MTAAPPAATQRAGVAGLAAEIGADGVLGTGYADGRDLWALQSRAYAATPD